MTITDQIVPRNKQGFVGFSQTAEVTPEGKTCFSILHLPASVSPLPSLPMPDHLDNLLTIKTLHAADA